MSDKPKFPRAEALVVAKAVVAALRPFCEPGRIIVAGSLRRMKERVGDVEVVYVSKTWQEKELRQASLLGDEPPAKLMVACDVVAWMLLRTGVLAQRINSVGAVTWGAKNKLALHVASRIPVDLFATTEAAWFNYLVCRTGSAENNTAIASAAKAKGWMWHPYNAGFTDETGKVIPVTSERDVFEFVGMPYKEPHER